MPVFIYMNHVDKHTHMHSHQKLSESNFKSSMTTLPFCHRSVKKMAFSRRQQVFDTSLKAYRWELLDNTLPKYKKKVIQSQESKKGTT